MRTKVAPYLKTTYELIARSFPNGIEADAYYPLLAVLAEELSDRNLAEVISSTSHKSYPQVLNDIYATRSQQISQSAIDNVKARLLAFGYREWLQES